MLPQIIVHIQLHIFIVCTQTPETLMFASMKFCESVSFILSNRLWRERELPANKKKLGFGIIPIPIPSPIPIPIPIALIPMAFTPTPILCCPQPAPYIEGIINIGSVNQIFSEKQLVIKNVALQNRNLLNKKYKYIFDIQDNMQKVGYNSFEAEDGNIIWAGALTLAWKQLAKFAKVQDEKFIVKGEQKQQCIANNFNDSKFSTKDLDQSCYYIKAGHGNETIAAINKERNEKFPDCTFPPLEIDLPPTGIISYAYLYKKVLYEYKFQKRSNPTFKFTNKNKEIKSIYSFFAETDEQVDQVFLCDYISNQNFVVKIQNKQKTDEIYLYKVGQEQPVERVIDKIINLQGKKPTGISAHDNFEVPILDLDYNRNVSEMIGVGFKNFPGYTIQGIFEGVKLKLDENGAIVENEGGMYIEECAIFSPRQLKFDSPFWVVMKEKGNHPYLAIRVNNL